MRVIIATPNSVKSYECKDITCLCLYGKNIPHSRKVNPHDSYYVRFYALTYDVDALAKRKHEQMAILGYREGEYLLWDGTSRSWNLAFSSVFKKVVVTPLGYGDKIEEIPSRKDGTVYVYHSLTDYYVPEEIE